MRKTLLTWVSVLGLGCLAAGAALSQSPPPATPDVKPQNLQMGTAPVGGTYYTLGAAIANIVEKHVPGLRITAQVTPGSSVENLELLMAHQIDLGMAGGTDIVPMMKSDKPWGNLRLLFAEHANAMHFIVRADSDIQSPADFRGRPIAVGNPNSGMSNHNEAILAAGWGLTFDDIDAKHIHVTPGLQALEDGNVDAVNFATGVPATAVLEAARATPLRLLSLTDAEVDKITDKLPVYSAYTIPAGTYPGQDKDVTTLGPVSFMLASDQMSDDVAYWITRSLFENLDELRATHPVGSDFSKQAAVDRAKKLISLGLKLHPGAERYFREIGVLK